MLLRTAKSCGPDAPTLASSSRMFKSALPGADRTLVRGRRWQKSPVTGESTKETVKTIACGNAGCSGVLVVTRVRFTTTIAHEAAGAAGIRRSPRPLRAENKATPRALRVARANACLLFEN